MLESESNTTLYPLCHAIRNKLITCVYFHKEFKSYFEIEAAMDEPDCKRIKCEVEDYSDESLHLLSIFPDLTWRHILDKLNRSADYFKLCQSFPDSQNLFSGYRTKVLFDDVIKIMVQRLENCQGLDVLLLDLVSLRRICKTWKRGVDSNLQNLSSNYKFSTEYKLPRSQFEKDLDSNFGYRFLQVDDYEEFLSHFESSHGTTDANPFITRRIIISVLVNRVMPMEPHMDLLTNSCLDMLRKYGKHVWYLHFEAVLSRFCFSHNPFPFFSLLKKILHHLPNLRVLKFDPPLELFIEHDVDSCFDVQSLVKSCLIPTVRNFETYRETGQYLGCRPEPGVGPRLRLVAFPWLPNPINMQIPPIQIPVQNPPFQVPVQSPQPPNQPMRIPPNHQIFWGNGPAQPRRVVQRPANPPAQFRPITRAVNIFRRASGRRGPVAIAGLPNPPIIAAPAFGNPEPDELPQVPVLPQLRFVHQGKLPFENFMEIIRPNLQNLTQLGVIFTSNEECKQFFELPLNLTKLEINFSKLDMPWFEIFPLLENRFGESLEHLHIYLPKPTTACQLRLPKLKVLHLLLDGPVPLDFLLGMPYNLEELYVKIGQMNQEESAEVQTEERRLVFYKHLGQLTNSNVWTEFPKLRKVRVSSHVEIENMTPFWQCTVDEWKSQKSSIK